VTVTDLETSALTKHENADATPDARLGTGIKITTTVRTADVGGQYPTSYTTTMLVSGYLTISFSNTTTELQPIRTSYVTAECNFSSHPPPHPCGCTANQMQKDAVSGLPPTLSSVPLTSEFLSATHSVASMHPGQTALSHLALTGTVFSSAASSGTASEFSTQTVAIPSTTTGPSDAPLRILRLFHQVLPSALTSEQLSMCQSSTQPSPAPPQQCGAPRRSWR